MHAGELLHEELALLRETILANDGANVASSAFARKVDQLIGEFYDDIGEVTALSLSDILDLFLIKVLYVNRKSRDAQTLMYLGGMLERYLKLGDLTWLTAYMSDLERDTSQPGGPFKTLFEAYRTYGDNALFISGLFPGSLGRKRGAGRMGGSVFADQSYYSTVGRRYYGMAAGQDLAQQTRQRDILQRLAGFFDVYVEALNEMSDRYVMGIDVRLITDKMLDAFNRYRETEDDEHLANAQKYASLLKLDGRQWAQLDELSRQGGLPTYY
jgi:hypothetical protein